MTASLLSGLIVSSLFLGMPSSTAADQTAPDQTAPDLLRAVHERQERMLAGIRDVTITHEDPRLSPTEHTIYAERSTGPNGSDLLARFNRHAETDWRPARDGASLTQMFFWLLPAELDERVIDAAVDGGQAVIADRPARVIEQPQWRPFLLSGGLLDMAFGNISMLRLFIDPERLRLLRVELVMEADPFARTPSDTVGITFAEHQEVSGFVYPRSQVFDLDSSPYASWEREHLESELASLRERAEALAEGRPTGGIPGIPLPDPRHEIEQIERYLRGEPEVAVITDVKVNSGPPPGAG